MTHICEHKCVVVGHRKYAIEGLVELLIGRVFQLGEAAASCEAFEDGVFHLVCLLVYVLEGASAGLDLWALSRLLLPIAHWTTLPHLLIGQIIHFIVNRDYQGDSFAYIEAKFPPMDLMSVFTVAGGAPSRRGRRATTG